MDVRVDAACARDRPGDVAPVGVAGVRRQIEIGAIDGKVGDDLLDRALQNGAGQIRRHRALAREARRRRGPAR